MNVSLVVVRSFGPHAKGDVVGDPSDVMKILACEDARNVVRIGASPTPGEDSKLPSASGNKSQES